MGYSCSARANYTLDQVEKLDEFDRYSSNYKYFIQVGKENKDGSITGTIYEFTGDWYTDKDMLRTRPIKKTGSFKINPNGSIARLPGVSKRMYGVLEIASIEAFDRDYCKGWNYVHS